MDHARALREFAEAIEDASASIFIGAGVSKGAGYPTWSELLADIAAELKLPIGKIDDLAALAQWSNTEEGGASRVRSVIKREIGQNLAVPESLQTLARLPIRHVWTTNYDRLIERSYEAVDRPYEVISDGEDLTIRGLPGSARIYKMHGTVDRLSDLVISTDDYELYRNKRAAFLPLLEAHLATTSMLFVGLSFSDPNLKHVLGAIRARFHKAPPEHYAIVKRPQEYEFNDDQEEEFKFRLRQHELWARDLTRYGLKSLEIDSFSELPVLLKGLERSVARNVVWVNGAYPIDDGERTEEVFRLSSAIGGLIASKGKKLLSGSGLTVGAGSVSGFLAGLNSRYAWNVDQRLIVRAFPQYEERAGSLADYWKKVRVDLARTSGVSIFVSGEKSVDGKKHISDGVLEEYDAAFRSGSFLLPVAFSGGAARKVAEKLRGSEVSFSGPEAQRPTDDELAALEIGGEAAMKVIDEILERLWRS